ncbi:hypothetical protein M3182_16540 [Mesobacillus maritimus]|uniref:hypothetical protein n=1 Tax=Mesobacillus maritimus TaxID=1643336 RepID=UPI00203B5633|nr:hypothetical protein [Mesobacillus maritimus]MCM3587347.1 hypothetical protein [Mesobacillus maritimus]
MKLYFLEECLGEIENISVEGMWMNGEIVPNKNMEKFNDFFAGIVDEESDFEEVNFSAEWLDDRNWFAIDDKNSKKGIYIPAVYPDREISWRWRFKLYTVDS